MPLLNSSLGPMDVPSRIDTAAPFDAVPPPARRRGAWNPSNNPSALRNHSNSPRAALRRQRRAATPASTARSSARLVVPSHAPHPGSAHTAGARRSIRPSVPSAALAWHSLSCWYSTSSSCSGPMPASPAWRHCQKTRFQIPPAPIGCSSVPIPAKASARNSRRS